MHKTTHSHRREITCDSRSLLVDRNGQIRTTYWQPREKFSYSNELLTRLFKTNTGDIGINLGLCPGFLEALSSSCTEWLDVIADKGDGIS